MENVDLAYICGAIGNLTGIPVRLFRGEELRLYHSVVELPKDPMLLYWEPVFAVRVSVGYFVTPHFNYYGVVNSGEHKIVVGPTRQIVHDPQELRALAFRLDIPAEDIPTFVSGMQNIVRMPLESVMQMLCVVNYILNGEKLGLRDITIFEPEQQELREALLAQEGDSLSAHEERGGAAAHNSLAAERAIMGIISRGDTQALRDWAASAPAVRAGEMAGDQLRQQKNTFVVSATLAARAAIRGGMDPEGALSMSDAFIQKCELLGDISRIINLQYHMIQEYTQQVERIRRYAQGSPLAIQVANYVLHNLSRPVTAEELARQLYLSRPYLSAKFKEETGCSLTDFILKTKTEEAKRLLRDTDKSLKSISAYLGFSSQSHFSRVFKKYSGHTPGEYCDEYAE